VGFSVVQRLPNSLMFATAGGGQPQQGHLVNIQDLVL
jgi:hypothetical protein